MPTIFSDIAAAFKEYREYRSLVRQHVHDGVPESVAKDLPELPAVLKGRPTNDPSRQDVHTQDDVDIMAPMFHHIISMANREGIPKRGSQDYRYWLDKLWKDEPILAGAVYSMEAKMQAMSWRILGGRNNANRMSSMLARARYLGGVGWSGFIGASAIDFYTQDLGVFWEVLREGDSQWGRMSDLATIDSRNCIMTGNVSKPVYYASSVVSQEIYYKPGEFIHFDSMPSPDEREWGSGYCAVSRASRAAKLLIALHDYDAEKLSNLPPEGIASVTGLTDREFRQAIVMWQAERKKNNSLTFPQVMWLVGNNPGAKVSVDIASFSQVPESFDRQTVVSQYVNTLALCFGVDTREFWAISTGALGTASEAEVQHMKARGKGGGEFISLVERALNAEFPQDTTFEFDTQDVEEDMIAAGIAKAWVDAYLPLVESEKGILSVDDFKRILADNRALPEWVVSGERAAITSEEVHKDLVEDIVRFVWLAGRLNCATLIDMSGAGRVAVAKDNGGPNIRGKPIPDDKVEEGARLTSTSYRDELKIWGEIDELRAYVPEDVSV
jgi:hypothetical protein